MIFMMISMMTFTMLEMIMTETTSKSILIAAGDMLIVVIFKQVRNKGRRQPSSRVIQAIKTI